MDLTRRSVIIAAASAALLSHMPTGPAAAAQTLTADVVVVGAGGTGLAAAASAAGAGARVIVLEKLGLIGGSSALAGGAIAAGNSNAQIRAGEKETTPEGFAQIWLDDQARSWQGGSPNYPNQALVAWMTGEFTKTVNWLESTVGHTFAKPRPFGYGGPNYAHAPAQAPIPASGRGSSPAGGRFVIQSLKSCLDRLGVEIRTGTPVEALLVDDKGAVTGVRARHRDDIIEVKSRAVVLAAGGFAHSREMLERLVPAFAPFADISAATPGATGDGILMAQEVGAAVYDDAWIIGLYVSGLKPELSKTYTSKDKYKDRVFVNARGERFVNEDLPYLTDPIGLAGDAWAIVDSSDAAKAEVIERNLDGRSAFKGEDWRALGEAMGVSPEALEETMTTYNADCAAGSDSVFGKPAAFMKPFTKAPFYAVRVVPQTGGTMGGVVTDRQCRVLRSDGSVIRGLYAGGEMMNRPFYNRVYTSGTGLGIAYTTGRIAGENAAKE